MTITCFSWIFPDAMNANKHFPNPNNVEFYEALEKVLKSLKTRKWRYNRKRQQENEEFPPNRRRRIEEIPLELEDTQEETENTYSESEETLAHGES